MRLTALGCFGGEAPGCHQTSLLVDDRLLLDAGSVSATLSLEAQARIDHVLVSHAHLNHVAALAFLADNLVDLRVTPIEVWGIPPVIQHLRTHLFNGVLWPDFGRIPSPRRPVLSFREIREGQPQRIGDYEILAVLVDHTVEAVGYLVSDAQASILFQGDSGPTREFWHVANAARRLQAVIVEASLPSRCRDLALKGGHLTPRLLADELGKLSVDVPIYAQHIKPRFFQEVVGELAALSSPRVTPLEQGRTYTFLAR